jgi:thiol:disulfide interchange protein DsbA
MRLFLRVLTTISLCFFAVSAGASEAEPKSGLDYITLSTPQPTDSGKKVEVVEFFGYFCPHCNVFDPMLSEWVKKQGNNIVFKRIPVAFNDSALPQQRLYFTLEAMGKLEELHKKIFAAIHADRQQLNKEEAIVDFVVKQGIDKQKFLDTYNSFSVQSKVTRATQMQGLYRIEGVPTIAIDGRFLTSPSIAAAGMPANHQSEASLQLGALNVMDVLVAKVIKEHGGTAVAAPKAKPKAVTKKIHK